MHYFNDNGNEQEVRNISDPTSIDFRPAEYTIQIGKTSYIVNLRLGGVYAALVSASTNEEFVSNFIETTYN